MFRSRWRHCSPNDPNNGGHGLLLLDKAGLSPKTDSLLLEDSKSPYACVIAVRTKDKADPVFQKLIKAYQSPEVKAFVEKQYKGAFVAVW